MKHFLRVLVLVAGLALFGWFVHRAGAAEIWRTVSRLGWSAPLVLVPFTCTQAADALGWFFAFGKRDRHGVPFRSFYRVRWSGEAVNNVIPSATVAGEAVKIYLLHKRGIAGHDATASVIVGRTIQTLMQVSFIALGAAAFLHVAGHKPGVAPAMIAILAFSLTLLGAMIWLQARGIFALLVRLADKFGAGRTAWHARVAALVNIDRQVLDFYRHDRRHFLLSAGGYACAWLLCDTMDIYLVSWLLGMPVDWLHALAIESFIGVSRLIGFLVPGSIGVQETGITLICSLAGLPQAFGPAYAIIRRGRDLAFVGIGWLMLYAEEADLKGFTKRVTAEQAEEAR
jgi:putative membrane protein